MVQTAQIEEPGQGISLIELIETGIILFVCLVIPLCISLAVSIPLADSFLSLKKQYKTFENEAVGKGGMDLELFLYIGIVIILTVILFLVWRKMADRKGKDQTPVEEGLELFGGSRLLHLEKKKLRRFGSTYRWKIIELYIRFVEFMALRGMGKETYQTPEEFSSILLEKKAADRTALMTLTRLFLIARFSNNEMGKSEYKEFKQLYDTIRNAVISLSGGNV